MLEVPITEIVKKIEDMGTEDMEWKICNQKAGYRHQSQSSPDLLAAKLEALEKKAGFSITDVRRIGTVGKVN